MTVNNYILHYPPAMHLHVQSSGNGMSMLTCGGLFCPIEYFTPWTDYFCKRYQVIGFDYRSHGQSSDYPDPESVTVSSLVKDATRVVEKYCGDNIILVGHSMGVRIACHLCVLFPQKVKAIVMICGSLFDGLGESSTRTPAQVILDKLTNASNPSWIKLASTMKNSSMFQSMIAQAGFSMGIVSRSQTPKRYIGYLMQHLKRLDVRMMRSLARSYVQHDTRPLLQDIYAPVLFVVGENDPFCSVSHAHQVAKLLPQVQLRVISHGSHLALVEHPTLVHGMAEAFLRDL